MIAALFKKQMMEVFSWIFKDRKNGKLRTEKGIAGYCLMYLVLFGFLGYMFYEMAAAICGPLLLADMGWLYWCLMGLLAIFLGVFGSVFNTYASLYLAKDNDLLLAMPIPPSRILAVRMAGVYAMGLMYELIVMIPAQIVWIHTADVSAAGIICTLCIPLVLSVLILVLSDFLGWVVALIAGKLRHKNIATVIITLGLLTGYYYAYGRGYGMIQEFVQSASTMGAKLKTPLYLMYQMGMAAGGSISAMAIFTAATAVLFAITWAVLSSGYLKLMTVNRGEVRKEYREKQAEKKHSVAMALWQKELRRFLGSATYMLNCGLGMILMPVSAAALVWKAGEIRLILSMLPQELMPVFAAGAVCLIAAMNDLSAPSVSLEGKNLWLLQAMPVSGRQVLEAKLRFHFVMTIVPAVPLLIAVEWLIGAKPVEGLMIAVSAVLFIFFMAEVGLALNLKMPNLTWTSEAVPVKQSAGVMISLFGGWGLAAAAVGLGMALKRYLGVAGCMAAVCLLYLVAGILLLRWIRTRGAEIFERL